MISYKNLLIIDDNDGMFNFMCGASRKKNQTSTTTIPTVTQSSQSSEKEKPKNSEDKNCYIY